MKVAKGEVYTISITVVKGSGDRERIARATRVIELFDEDEVCTTENPEEDDGC